jgi:hypothetical protein
MNFNFLHAGAIEDASPSSHTTDEINDTIHHQGTSLLPAGWILLDNQSTVNVFCNPKMLRNIRPAKTTMGYGEVWFNPKGIANILSLAKVEEQHRVTYDSADGQGFTVHKGDGVTRQFKKSKRGLFYLNVTERTGTALVNTVADNQNRYTVRSYKQAELARKIQNMLGRPSTRDYL